MLGVDHEKPKYIFQQLITKIIDESKGWTLYSKTSKVKYRIWHWSFISGSGIRYTRNLNSTWDTPCCFELGHRQKSRPISSSMFFRAGAPVKELPIFVTHVFRAGAPANKLPDCVAHIFVEPAHRQRHHPMLLPVFFRAGPPVKELPNVVANTLLMGLLI